MAVILGLRQKIPQLFSAAGQLDKVNVFDLLEAEKQLVDILASDQFKRLHSEKVYINLAISPPSDGLLVKEITIKPEAIEEWKYSLLTIISKLDKVRYPTPQELLEILRNNSDKEKFKEDPLEILEHIGSIREKNGRKGKISQLKGELKSLIECKKQSSLIKKYNCIFENYNELKSLPELPPLEKIKQIISLLEETDTLTIASRFSLLIDAFPQAGTASTWEELIASINQLNQNILMRLNDIPEVVVPHLCKIMALEESDPRIKILSQNHKKWINHFTKQTIGHQKKIMHEIILEEVPPLVGIFRGFIGRDCSTISSFPHPNDPHERVFFVKKIKNDKEKLKGYVSATEVLVNNQKALYVHTISGSKIGSGDTELILRGLDQAKDVLGINSIVLPCQQNVEKFINFTAIKAVYEKHVKNGELFQISYQDKDLRFELEKFQSKYNTAEYDFVKNNTEAIVFLLKNNDVIVSTKMEQNILNINSLDEYLKSDIFQFIIESINTEMWPQLMGILTCPELLNRLNTQSVDIIKRLDYLLYYGVENSQQRLTVKQFKKIIINHLEMLGIKGDYLQANSHIMIPGYFTASDAFSDENIEEAAQLWLKFAPSLEEPAQDEADTEFDMYVLNLIKSHRLRLGKTKIFQKLKDGLLLKLGNEDPDRRVVALRRLRKFEVSDDIFVDKIYKALKDTNLEVCNNAALWIRECKPELENGIEYKNYLLRELDDKEPLRRWGAIDSLIKLKLSDDIFVDKIYEALKDTDFDVCLHAALWIRKCKPELENGIEYKNYLLREIEEGNSERKTQALHYLKKSQFLDLPVQLKIFEMLKDTDKDVALGAAIYLKDTALESAIELKLVEILELEPELESMVGLIFHEKSFKTTAVLLKLAQVWKKQVPASRKAIFILSKANLESGAPLPKDWLKDPDTLIQALTQKLNDSREISNAETVPAFNDNPWSIRLAVIRAFREILPASWRQFAAGLMGRVQWFRYLAPS